MPRSARSGRSAPGSGQGTAVTLDEVPPGAGIPGSAGMPGSAGPPARDTFSSQQSDARRALPKSRTGLFLLAGARMVTGQTVVVDGGLTLEAR